MDDRNSLVIVVALAVVSGLGVIGQTILAAMGKPPEPAIIAIAATSVGGLLGFLQQRPAIIKDTDTKTGSN